ncbi:MAG: hypothetical protein A2X49_04570 [Lentisphaerae bacterium GWF2_52_8]|nr:MAG: hypothetical protein A2X49_04570 [Lentisphaerae bacterium GWF2_52_8]
MDFLPITFLAALSTGIATSCLLLAIFQLMELISIEKDALKEEEAKRLPLLLKIFMPFTGNVLFLVRNPVFDGMRTQTQDLILMAGYDQSVSADQFLAIRILSCIMGIFFMILGFITGHPMGAMLMGLMFFIYPNVWLKGTVKRRHLEILKALPNVLDLLTLSVEAGKDFLTALRDILSRRKMDALGEELGRTFQEIQLGKPRQKALKELAQRVQQSDLTSVLNAIIQADELGVSIGQLLRIQGDQLRNKRFSRAEKLANEAPVKILFPVIIFIFPAVIVILMAPIIMQAMKTLVK